MTKEVKGVFVRLPLDEAQIMKLYNPKKSGNENLLTIGTPVTGGDIPVAAYTSQHDIDRVRKGKSGDIYGAKNWEGSDEEVFNIPLIRQSDAQAQIAALEAEVRQLQNHLASTLEVALSRADGTTCIHLVKQAFSLAKTTELTDDEVVSHTLGELFPIMKGGAA